MRYYKILNETEFHRGMGYRTGLNVDILPFQGWGDCEPGGIYFAREDILSFLDYGPWIREVTLPEGARLYQNPSTPVKWKADQVILGERRRLTPEVVKELIAEGANVSEKYLSWVVWRDEPELLRPYLDRAVPATLWKAVLFSSNDCAKMLIEYGIKPWDELLGLAIENDNKELTEMLIHLATKSSLNAAAIWGRIETMKLLLDGGVRSDMAIFFAARDGNMECVRLLAPFGVESAISYAKEHGYRDIVRMLSGL